VVKGNANANPTISIQDLMVKSIGLPIKVPITISQGKNIEKKKKRISKIKLKK
jgi:hypothetical protein